MLHVRQDSNFFPAIAQKCLFANVTFVSSGHANLLVHSHVLPSVVFTGCQNNADILFAISGSSTVGARNFRKVQQVLQRFVQQFHISASLTRVAMIQYSCDVQVRV